MTVGNNKIAKDEINISYEQLGQYDDDFFGDLMDNKEKEYAQSIGSFLMWFGTLEHILDIAIADQVRDGWHEMGYLIIKDMKIIDKINFFYNILCINIRYCENGKKKKKIMSQLLSIKKKLIVLNTLRNKIAHAKWYSLDKEGYVRTNIRRRKSDGSIVFQKHKITPLMMKRGVTDIKSILNRIDILVDENLMELFRASSL